MCSPGSLQFYCVCDLTCETVLQSGRRTVCACWSLLAKETYYRGKRDLLQRCCSQGDGPFARVGLFWPKRPTIEAKETYYRGVAVRATDRLRVLVSFGQRDLLQRQKRPTIEVLQSGRRTVCACWCARRLQTVFSVCASLTTECVLWLPVLVCTAMYASDSLRVSTECVHCLHVLVYTAIYASDSLRRLL